MECVESRMEVEHSRAFIDNLYSHDAEVCIEAAKELKFQIVGNKKMKANIVEQGVVTRLMQIFKAPDSSLQLKTEIIVILNSVAKGDESQAASLVKAGIVPAIFEHLEAGHHNDSEFLQRVLCCLRSVYQQGCVPAPPSWNQKLLNTLVQYGYGPPTNQECIANVLAHVCKSKEQQQQLMEAGAGDLVGFLLSSKLRKIQLPALLLFAALCVHNEAVAKKLKWLRYKGKDLPSYAVELMSREKAKDIQLAAGTCMTYLYRAGALEPWDKSVRLRTVQCLARLCRNDCTVMERVEAAHAMSYLMELSVELQATAAITDHFPVVCAEFLKYNSDHHKQAFTKLRWPLSDRSYHLIKYPEDSHAELMKIAAFTALTSLTANDEGIRKRVIEIDGVMFSLVTTLKNGSMQEQMAAVRCLHSLSRSVQTLRTGFQDFTIWKPLMRIIKESTNEEFITVACSSLCNLLLEFSPSKEYILDHGAIEILCNLTRRHGPSLRLNTVWALMNAAFQADLKTKTSIIQQLGTDQIFNLLGDCDVNVIMKTLGLLRNLLSTTQHIDQIMNSHGKEIMQGIIMVLENEHTADVKEQALCILANIADGIEAKGAIMSNEDILKKLMNYMVMPYVKLQIAATYCISNLVATSSSSTESLLVDHRQEKLKAMGVDKILENLLGTTDANLYDKVKKALDYFNESSP